MYNRIGQQTSRGSGTNGHVQANWSTVRKSREKLSYNIYRSNFESDNRRKPNEEILDHDRKRKIEIKCLELSDMLEEEGCPTKEIEEKVQAYRSLLLSKENKSPTPTYEYRQVNVRETAGIAEARQENDINQRLALGYTKCFMEQLAREAEMKELDAANNKVCKTIRASSKIRKEVGRGEKKNKRKRSGNISKKKSKKSKIDILV